MASATSKAARPVPRACKNCATAKAKCVRTLQIDNSVCERCARLQLNCEAQPPIVRKGRESKAIRISTLENKLDSIVTLLSSAHALHVPALPEQGQLLSPTLLSQTLSDPTSAELSGSSIQEPRDCNRLPLLTVAVDNMALSKQQPFSESRGHTRATYEEQEALFNIFQTHMIIYCPFVFLGSSSTATLRVERPFLFATIMLGASRRKVTRQTPAGRSLLQSFTERYLLDGKISLDLLQAILVYLEWCNYQYRNNPQISVLIQLAMSLVTELGLNKMPRSIRRSPQQKLADATTPSCKGPAVSQYHSSEEMRAFLGCFYLSSVISASFKKVEAMTYTPYTDECCNVLEQRNECSTDMCLVKLVRAQALVGKIAQSLPSSDLEPLWSPMTPVGMIVNALEAELENLATPDMQVNTTFLLHYHSVQISLYEVGLHRQQETLGCQNFPQLELLYSCLLSVKAYFAVYFLVPVDYYFTLPCVVWIQLADTLVILSRLLLIDINGWDLSHARKLVDLAAILDRLERNFEDAGKVAQATGLVLEDEDMFHAYAVKMRYGKASYEAKLASELAESQQVTDALVEADTATLRDSTLYDNIFWQEALVDWDDFGYTGTAGTWI